MARRGRARGARRDYARSERVGELLRQIIAEELDRIDDERLAEVAITGVEVDNELMKAVVYYDALDEDAEHAAALEEHRRRLKSAIGSQARLRRTPELVFDADPSISTGSRIDEILAGLEIPPADDADEAGDDVDGAGGPSAPPA